MKQSFYILSICLLLAGIAHAGEILSFNPTAADTDVQDADLESATTGATNAALVINGTTTVKYVGDTNAVDFALVLDGTSARYSSVTFNFDAIPFVSGTPVVISFDMAYARAGSPKFINMRGTDGGFASENNVFQYNWNLGASIIIGAEGAPGFGGVYESFWGATADYSPAVMKTFTVTIDGTNMVYAAEGLTSATTTVLNAKTQLTGLRFLVNGNTTAAQGFWLDNVVVKTIPKGTAIMIQ